MPRFIPVGTGNTQGLNSRAISSAVHPRGHGEHSANNPGLSTPHGSSPWARGTRLNAAKRVGDIRFIPVGTGNTQPAIKIWRVTAVHPRGHGEHNLNAYKQAAMDGSSPWARGTQNRTQLIVSHYRFIPVGTGNTRRTLATCQAHSVHPRGHGEHDHIVKSLLFIFGSSPWARGTPHRQTARQSLIRFIPVGTGNTFLLSNVGTTLTVHPRGHGEHTKFPFLHATNSGSSPWARGTL